MANRRFGAAGPQQRGGPPMNRNFNSHPPNISPWQGGATPSNPNNNIQNQLAMALTSLIQQTAQHQNSDGPPSLLNMNNPSGGYSSYQDRFNGPNNRFGNRGRQDFRRPEPYNKSNRGGGGGQWRSDNRNIKRGPGGVGGMKAPAKNRPNFNKTPVKDQTKKLNDKSPKQDKPTNENSEGEKQATNGEKAPTSYDGLPNGLLHCFICNKSMWDGESFQNHLGGKAHKQMICSLEESFQITVNILRENMRLCEERKMIEYERMQRARRFHQNQQEPESHCNMCDLKFMGRIVVHRQTDGHQRLKRFLHPKCKRCNLEFPSRMEWVDHQFSHEHLFKLKEYLDTKNLAPGEYRLEIDEAEVAPPLEEALPAVEHDNPILEMTDSLENLNDRIPVYKEDRELAKESVVAAEGFICNLCNLFMPGEEESQNHLKTFHHYHHFVETVKLKYQTLASEKRKKKEEEAAAKEAKEGEESKEDEEMKEDEEEDGEKEEENEEEAQAEEEEEAEGEGEAEAEGEVEGEAEAEEEEEEVKEEEKEEEKKEEKKEEVKEAPKKEEPPPAAEKKAPAAAPAVPSTPNTRGKRATAAKSTPGPKSKKAKN